MPCISINARLSFGVAMASAVAAVLLLVSMVFCTLLLHVHPAPTIERGPQKPPVFAEEPTAIISDRLQSSIDRDQLRRDRQVRQDEDRALAKNTTKGGPKVHPARGPWLPWVFSILFTSVGFAFALIVHVYKPMRTMVVEDIEDAESDERAMVEAYLEAHGNMDDQPEIDGDETAAPHVSKSTKRVQGKLATEKQTRKSSNKGKESGHKRREGQYVKATSKESEKTAKLGEISKSNIAKLPSFKPGKAVCKIGAKGKKAKVGGPAPTSSTTPASKVTKTKGGKESAVVVKTPNRESRKAKDTKRKK